MYSDNRLQRQYLRAAANGRVAAVSLQGNSKRYKPGSGSML
jgi:hypothetical protein